MRAKPSSDKPKQVTIKIDPSTYRGLAYKARLLKGVFGVHVPAEWLAERAIRDSLGVK